MSTIAVLTNDLQFDLVNKNEARRTAVKKATPAYTDFLKAMRAHGHHVVHLQMINPPDDPIAERYEGGFLPVRKGTEGAAVMPEFLGDGDGDIVIEKNKDSGFYETDLHERLRKLGVDTVIVTGMQTQICVQTTAADAFFRQYKVWVPSDCVISARPEDTAQALDWMDGYCACVAPSKEILEILDEQGDLPRKQFVSP